MLKRAVFVLFPLLLLSGCAHRISQKKLMSIDIGLNKQEVIRRIGDPNVFRGSMVNKFGQKIEVYEYEVNGELNGKKLAVGIGYTIATLGIASFFLPAFIEHKVNTYWLYFHDNKLVQWGQAGDWKKESDHIQEIRFR